MEVRIEKLVYGGDGLAHHDGQTVFVPLVLPGELVEIDAAERKKKFVRGRLDRVVEASPERVAASCRYYARCGGCQYQHIPYEAQLRYKAEILRETLCRIGRIQWDGPIETHASPPYGYRNRAQWKLRADAANAAADGGIGYYEMGSTKLCAIEECPIVSPRLNDTLSRLRGLASQRKTLAAIDEIEVFADSNDDKILLNLSAERLDDSPQSIAAALRGALPSAESILIQDRGADKFHLDGPGFLNYAAAGATYRVGHLSFFQVNRSLIETLVEAVTGGTERGKLALDLYAGVGLFSVALAKRFDRVIGVESNAAAAKDLELNLAESGGASPAGRNMTTEAFLSRWRDRPDLVVVDPPRAGVEASALTQLRRLAPAHILYVSCDPSTLGRDLAQLVGSGTNDVSTYEIESMNLFDIFPQTYHMEVLVRLRRRA